MLFTCDDLETSSKCQEWSSNGIPCFRGNKDKRNRPFHKLSTDCLAYVDLLLLWICYLLLLLLKSIYIGDVLLPLLLRH